MLLSLKSVSYCFITGIYKLYLPQFFHNFILIKIHNQMCLVKYKDCDNYNLICSLIKRLNLHIFS